MAKESTIKKGCAELIRRRGGWARSHPGGPMSAGMADLFGCYRKYCLVIETKMPGKERTLTPLQAETLRRAREAGAIAKVVTSVKQMESILNAIDRKLDRK